MFIIETSLPQTYLIPFSRKNYPATEKMCPHGSLTEEEGRRPGGGPQHSTTGDEDCLQLTDQTCGYTVALSGDDA